MSPQILPNIASVALFLFVHATLASQRKFEVVVCRWNEDVAWLAQTGAQYTVYNKGDRLEDPDAVELDSNVGKENYCYLKHIIDNYDSQTHRGAGLAELTLFSQASPFDHVPDTFLEQVKPTRMASEPSRRGLP